MQKFKRKSLYLALVAAVSSLGIANTANAAVNVNGNGLGQVLIYPYYSTRAGSDTYLSVVNTTNSSKAVKVRFTEGKNSREVLDFNLYLSPRDMWTAAVVNTNVGAKLVTTDKSCTFPKIPVTGQSFTDRAFLPTPIVEGISTAGGDGASGGMDRTREGYFEIIEMGVITNTAVIAAITHVSGLPANCSVVQTNSMDMSSGLTAVTTPSGGLAGTATLINVAGGTDFSYDPVALDSFALGNLWFPAGSILPNLEQGDPNSVVFNNGTTVNSNWGIFGVDAVSAVLMHNNIINEYVLDNTTFSGTDWVVTMPTKRYYVPVDNPATSSPSFSATEPFTKTFWTNGACEPVGLSYWNREEGNVVSVDFSPPSPDGGAALCWEVNVLTFNRSAVLGSVNETHIDNVPFENGWLKMTFNDAGHRMISTDGDTYLGLPTVGFMVQDFVNGNVNGLLSNYGGNFSHKFTSSIVVGN